MKQSKYPPAELRYGENLVAIEYFNFHKDDADAGNPYNTTFGMKVISRAFQGYASCEYDIKDFRIFLDQLCELYAFQRDRVVLSEICYGSNVTLSMDRTGHVKVEGLIFDNAMEQSLTFAFEADQSTLPPLISGLKNMIS